MGTRSTTKFLENGQPLMTIYKQYDGYVKNGWGDELKKFIKSGKFVNGFGKTEEKQFNGFGCFVLQLISEYKTGVGGLYLSHENDKQQYNYSINYIEKYKDMELVIKKIEISCDEDENYFETIDLQGKNNGGK